MGYSKETYESAEAELERRRTYAESQFEKRQKKLYAENPRIQAIQKEMSSLSINAAMAVIKGADKDEELRKLKEKSTSLKNELKQIFYSKNLPQDYLKVWYNCEVCNDTGYIDGKMCVCMKELLKQKEYENLNSLSALELSDFCSFSFDYYSKNELLPSGKSIYDHMIKTYNHCEKYANDFDEKSPSLLMQGMPGLGKTHLSLAIAKSVINKGFGVVYVSAPQILRELENEYYNFNRQRVHSIMDTITNCDLFIFDDLGTETMSKYSVSAVHEIINTRLTYSKPTIISTNLLIKDLEEKYLSRTVSRIIGMYKRLEFVGTDIRQLKKNKQNQNF